MLSQLEKKRPRQVSIGIYLDESLADRAEAAQAELIDADNRLRKTRLSRIAEYATAGGTPDDVVARVDADDAANLLEYRERYDKTVAELDADTVWFTFTALPRDELRSLLAVHPPTDEDHERAQAAGNDRAEYHDETFIPALIKASISSFELTDLDLESMFHGQAWSDAELAAVTSAALSANTAARLAQPR